MRKQRQVEIANAGTTTAEASTSADTIARPRGDWWLAASVAVVALCAYVPTLLPGVGGSGDAAKFQFVGRVLGTPHQPGYPTYVLVSHLFSRLPIGSLAYRINLMSALWAAVGAGLMCLVVRRLGGTRWAAAAAALGLAFGRCYWGSAVMAEVYSFAAALELATLLKLLDWGATRRQVDLFAAVAIASLAAGNHLTIAFAVPALILYVLLRDARTALRPHTLAIAAVLIALGLAQYLFIIARTLQHAPYLEASATNLRQLLAVVTARDFSYEIFMFDRATLVGVRLPAVLSFVRDELRLPALLLLVPGVWWLWRRGWRELLLLAVAFIGLFVVTANVGSDVNGFIVPTVVFVWPVVGAGISALVAVPRLRAGRAGRIAVGAALAALVVVPLAAANYRVNDHHRRTFETRYLDALFAALPRKAVLVQEAYSIDQLVLYKLLGEDAARGRDIRIVPRDPSTVWDCAVRGYNVFAFVSARDDLETFGFRFVPMLVRNAPDTTTIPLFVLSTASRCESVGDGAWRELGDLAAARATRLFVRLDNYHPFTADGLLYLAANRPLSPRIGEFRGTGTPRLETTSFSTGTAGARRSLEAALAADAVPPALAGRLINAPEITRVRVEVNDDGQWAGVSIDVGTEIQRALVAAHVDRPSPRRSQVCVQRSF